MIYYVCGMKELQSREQPYEDWLLSDLLSRNGWRLFAIRIERIEEKFLIREGAGMISLPREARDVYIAEVVFYGDGGLEETRFYPRFDCLDASDRERFDWLLCDDLVVRYSFSRDDDGRKVYHSPLWADAVVGKKTYRPKGPRLDWDSIWSYQDYLLNYEEGCVNRLCREDPRDVSW